jgi:hypothetical protein
MEEFAIRPEGDEPPPYCEIDHLPVISNVGAAHHKVSSKFPINGASPSQPWCESCSPGEVCQTKVELFSSPPPNPIIEMRENGTGLMASVFFSAGRSDARQAFAGKAASLPGSRSHPKPPARPLSAPPLAPRSSHVEFNNSAFKYAAELTHLMI